MLLKTYRYFEKLLAPTQ